MMQSIPVVPLEVLQQQLFNLGGDGRILESWKKYQ